MTVDELVEFNRDLDAGLQLALEHTCPVAGAPWPQLRRARGESWLLAQYHNARSKVKTGT